MVTQLALDSMGPVGCFPETRYQGSKLKLLGHLIPHLTALGCESCLDAFGGTSAVSYALKEYGITATYNDVLHANYEVGLALIENSSVLLSEAAKQILLAPHDSDRPVGFIERTFHDIYFTDEENRWLDETAMRISQLADKYQRALAYWALFQACIAKRPYNLFHRKNLYMRTAEVKRSFGNKATWETPFPVMFERFAAQANRAVFDNGRPNRACCTDAREIEGAFDLVYIDTPYMNSKGTSVDYRDFYHFLEGLVHYEEWADMIDYSSKHRRLVRHGNDWCNKKTIHNAFDELFERHRGSILAVSYRDDGIPSMAEVESLMRRHKKDVRVAHVGRYQYVLSKNRDSHEVLLLGT